MKSSRSRTWLYAIVLSLSVAAFIAVTGGLPASPADEISNAVAVDGAVNVMQATTDVFLNAVASVLVSVDQKNSAAYIDAANHLRPDLKDQIAQTAIEIYTGSDETDASGEHCISQHHRLCTICHRCKNYDDGHGDRDDERTLRLPCKKARWHLQHHPKDTRGPCPPE